MIFNSICGHLTFAIAKKEIAYDKDGYGVLGCFIISTEQACRFLELISNAYDIYFKSGIKNAATVMVEYHHV